MEPINYQKEKENIQYFAQQARSFEAGELDRKDYKGISGKFGSYAQRGEGNMLRLRMPGGVMNLDKLGFVADMVERFGINRLKLTTCQTLQLHNLSADETAYIMEAAMDHGIFTKGGGGDNPRNVMMSPLAGVLPGEYMDVRPWAMACGEYLLGRVDELHMPRKLKVAFSGGADNETHATFRDLGFVALPDGGFRVYCAGGLGPNPKLGVCVEEKAAPEDVLHYADAMIRVFTTHGNYTNRARSRTRYLQDTLGVEGLQQAFRQALEESRAAADLRIHPADMPIEKAADGTVSGARVIAQKQPGLYAVSYHPLGGNLPAGKPRQLHNLLADMEQAEIRIAPGGTIYIVNLTGKEAEKILAATADGANTLFETSVSCIGASICQHGVRDSQGLLQAMLQAVKPENFADGVLPRVRISGCPSSCDCHQVGEIGFVGGVKIIDKVPHPAFTVMLGGDDHQGQETFGQNLGAMLEESIPAFMVELGKTIAAQNTTYAAWIGENRQQLLQLAEKYIVK